MKRKQMAILLANLCCISSVLAADGDDTFTFSGSVGVGVQGSGVSTQSPTPGARPGDDKSKLNEYRDLGSGLFGTFDVQGRGNQYWLNAFGENLSRDDQYIDLTGGKYGVFKYQLWDKKIIHNYGFDLVTPYAGVGTSTLTATGGAAGFTNTNPANWNKFDLGYKRDNRGGMFEFSNNSPWYLRVDANQVLTNGTKLVSAAFASPGGPFADLAAPVDYKTQNFTGEAGYSSKRGHFAVNYTHSQFFNSNPFLNFSNGNFSNAGGAPLDRITLLPNNTQNKWGTNGMIKDLPLGSTLSGRLTYAQLTSDAGVEQRFLSAAGPTFTAVPSNVSNYHGEIVNKTASLSLTSNPTKALDTRIYWNWYRKDNNSTAVTWTTAVDACGFGTGTVCSTELFNLKKANLGIDLGYRFNRENKVSGGFDWLDINRNRPDFNRTIDKKVYLEYKNSMLDTVTGRIKYQYLMRRSTFVTDVGTATSVNSAFIELFVKRFDAANVDQHQVKFAADWSPQPMLDLGVETIYKHNNFRETQIGRTKDRRAEVFLNGSYGDPKVFRVNVFFDTEFINYDSSHRAITGAVGPVGSGDPNSGFAAAATYNWTAKAYERNWALGTGADWPYSDRMMLKGSLIYSISDGNTDFASQTGASLLPLPSLDNTRKFTLNLRSVYQFNKEIELTGGFAYEKYRFDDAAYDGYRNTLGAGLTRSYLSGAFAFQNYTASMLYLLGKYKF
ncbi:MAG: MtrB/PioB family outer membrane beta-barrel protein [Betaproteobacteria bacterium]|nr:MtrB/PioB family outer membrane beta-barrel protein [Betaproteobacteria bacterium]